MEPDVPPTGVDRQKEGDGVRRREGLGWESGGNHTAEKLGGTKSWARPTDDLQAIWGWGEVA